MSATNWITLILGLGVGSIVTAVFQHLLKQKEVARESQRKDLEARYRVIILLMYAAYDFDSNKAVLRINRPDLTSRESVLEELNAEWFNMLLFASAKTLESLRSFIENPGKAELRDTAFSMREDLGRGTLEIEI